MRRKIKWIVTVIIMLAFVIFGKMIPSEELTVRSMAVGLGIDVTEDNKYIVTAQILSSNGSQTMGNGTRVVRGQGESLTDALQEITEITSKTLTVTHCNVLVLGKSVFINNAFEYVIYMLIKSTYLSDSIYVFGYDGNTYDVFSQKTAFGDNASLYVQGLVSQHGTMNDISYQMLSQCAVGYYSKSGINWMPYLKKIPVASKIPSSDEFEEVKDTDDYVFDLTSIVMLKKGKIVGVFDKNGTKAVNYITSKVEKGSEEFVLTDKKIGYYVNDSDIKLEFDEKKMAVDAKLTLFTTVKSIMVTNGDGYPLGTSASEDEIKECAKILQGRIYDFYEKLKENNLDAFNFQQGFFAKDGIDREDFNLNKVEFNLSVDIKVEK